MKNIVNHYITLLVLLLVSSPAYSGIPKTLIKYIYDDFINGEKNDNLMVGSSSIKRLTKEHGLNCVNWINRGMGNSTISDVITYINYTPLSSKPKYILVYVGENDIASGLNPNEVIEEYKHLILMLLKKFPTSDINILAIKLAPHRERYWASFSTLNDAIKKFTLGHKNTNFYSLDWYSYTDQLDQLFVDDGVHLSLKGYQLFLNELDTKICKTK